MNHERTDSKSNRRPKVRYSLSQTAAFPSVFFCTDSKQSFEHYFDSSNKCISPGRIHRDTTFSFDPAGHRYQKSSPAEIADHVAVHESGVKSVVKTGQRVGTGGNSQDPANIRRKS